MGADRGDGGPAAAAPIARAAASFAPSPDGTGLRFGALALALLAGIGWQLQQPELWPRSWLLAMALGALCAGAAAVFGRGRARARAGALAAGLAAAFLAGAVAAALQAAWRLDNALDPELEGEDVRVTGIVASLPRINASGDSFAFEVEKAELRGRALHLPSRIAVGWYRGWHDEAVLGDPREGLRAGQRWRIAVRLRAPHGSLNPNGFDYELWLLEQGLRATGYVRATPAEPPRLLDAAAGYPVERARQAVREAIQARVPDARSAGVLAALAVGDQSAIEREDWDLFRRTGIAHLVSISGLHVTMFAWLAGRLIGAAWRRSERAMLRWPAPAAARWGGVAAAAAYALFSGWGVPSQRTVWMLATAALLQSLSRRWPWPLVLLAAALVVALVDPWALPGPGFWLSYCAVALLMASGSAAATRPAPAPAGGIATRGMRALAGHAAEGARAQAIATLGLAPLTLVFFQQLSVVGYLANLVAIPAITLAITPLALLGIAVPPLWSVAAALMQALSAWLGVLAALPGAAWAVGAAPWWAAACGLLGGALAILPLPPALRLLALPLVLPLLWPPQPRPAEGAFELLAADVGQGTAVLLRTRRHLLVYDTGPAYSRDSDAGQRVLVPLLQARGEHRIDRLMLSHRDTDHVGGAASLLRALPVGELWSSLEPAHPLLAMAPSTTRCEAGQRWQWDGVRFEVLHPRAADYARPGVKANALSCVLRVEGGGHSALLAGDIERDGETDLVASHGASLRSELLVVPHHGSKTSSTPAFLDAVDPRFAVFQAGYRNRFGHPAPEVLARYEARGVRIFTSPACGALVFAPADAGPVAACEREAARRYWHHRLPAQAQR